MRPPMFFSIHCIDSTLTYVYVVATLALILVFFTSTFSRGPAETIKVTTPASSGQLFFYDRCHWSPLHLPLSFPRIPPVSKLQIMRYNWYETKETIFQEVICWNPIWEITASPRHQGSPQLPEGLTLQLLGPPKHQQEWYMIYQFIYIHIIDTYSWMPNLYIVSC